MLLFKGLKKKSPHPIGKEADEARNSTQWLTNAFIGRGLIIYYFL